jgi:hypothetical protein
MMRKKQGWKQGWWGDFELLYFWNWARFSNPNLALEDAGAKFLTIPVG